MIKITLNKSEIQTLISLLVNAEYHSIKDIYARELTQDKIKHVLRKLNNKLLSYPAKKKEPQIGFKPAELAALHLALSTYLPLRLDVYEDTLVTKINMFIEQKAA